MCVWHQLGSCKQSLFSPIKTSHILFLSCVCVCGVICLLYLGLYYFFLLSQLYVCRLWRFWVNKFSRLSLASEENTIIGENASVSSLISTNEPHLLMLHIRKRFFFPIICIEDFQLDLTKSIKWPSVLFWRQAIELTPWVWKRWLSSFFTFVLKKKKKNLHEKFHLLYFLYVIFN